MDDETHRTMTPGLANQFVHTIYEMFEIDLVSPARFCYTMEALVNRDEDGYPSFKDIEAGHGAADELMLEVLERLGYGAGCAIFRSAKKWYA